MSDVSATFNYDADFTSAISQIKLLAKELSVLNNSFNSLDKNARKVRDEFADTFKASVGDLGGFSAKTIDITSSIDDFGRALDKNKLKLRDYYREATRAFNAQSNARKLAEDQIRRTKAQLVDLGMDAEGRRKGILVTPMKLDMSDMQTQLQVARKQFDIFNKLVQDGATQLINWGKNTQWAGRQLTVGLTVPLTLFAQNAIKAFNDVDKELTRFQKVYGSDLVASVGQSTDVIRGQVQALAVDIAKRYGIAAKETAALSADLAATGLEGQKLLESVKETTRLSVLGEVDRQTAMKTTLSLQTAFNLSTKELSDSINFLNAVENQTSVSLQDLTDAIPKVGPVVKALGGDVKDLSVLLVAMKEGGVNAAEGANALKSGLASLINPTKQASDTAKQYGIDLEGIVKRNKGQLLPTILDFQKSLMTLDELGKAKVIEQLFGKYQFARISALFDNLNKQGSQTKQVIELMSASSADLARVANQEIQTLTQSASMRFQRAMEAIKASLLPVGQAIAKSVLPFLEKFSSAIDKVVQFFGKLPEPIKNFLKLTTGLTAIAGPLIMITGVLGNFLGYIIKGAMGFVNLGRRMAGLPTEKFELLGDHQIAAAKATDVLSVSIDRQKTAMVGLNKEMILYLKALEQQRLLTPNLFSPTATPARTKPGKKQTGGVVRLQSGSWVPGSGSGDKVPALLEPGEFVVNRNAAMKYGGQLEAMNSSIPRFQNGGILRFATRITPGGIAPVLSLRGRAYGTRTSSSLPERAPIAVKATGRNRTQTPEDLAMLQSLSIEFGVDLTRAQSAQQLYELLSSVPKSRLALSRNKSSTKNPVVPIREIAASNFKTGWSTKDSELEILNRYGIKELGYASSHLQKSTVVLPDGTSVKIWRGGNLIPDLQALNNAFEMNGISVHPTTIEEAIGVLSQLKTKVASAQPGSAAERYGRAAIDILQTRIGGDFYTRFVPAVRGELSNIDKVGVTSQVWKTQPKQFGGLIRAQAGAWVPGSGSGDRVPALLEPGEFVVNKNAAMRYGGFLNHINFKDAPRFQTGGMPSSQKIGNMTNTVFSLAFILPQFFKLNDAMVKLINNVSMAAAAMQVLGALGGGGLKNPVGGIKNILSRGPGVREAARKEIEIGRRMLDGAKVAAERRGALAGASRAATGVGRLAMGAGRLAMGALMSPVGLIGVATVGAILLAVKKYRDEINKAKEATKQSFTVGQETANAYGVEIQNINDKLKENKELAKNLGVTNAQSTTVLPVGISEEKKKAIATDNKALIDTIKGAKTTVTGSATGTRFATAGGQITTTDTEKQKNLLLTKFATLRQQGFSQQDAMEVVTQIAKESGDSVLSMLQGMRPELEKMAGDNATQVFKETQAAQLKALTSTKITSAAGSSESFRVAFQGALDSLQYAPPQDQLEAMNELIKNITNMDSTQLVQAGKALVEAANANYGSDSGIAKTIAVLTAKGDAASLATATKLDTAAKAGLNPELLIQITADNKISPDEQTLIDNFLKERDIKAQMQIDVNATVDSSVKELDKALAAEQASLQSQLDANDGLIDKENKRYENAQKHHQRFIKARQKEIDSINKGADKYINALQKEAKAESFLNDQRKTALSGLEALASGDVIGFLQSRVQQASDAQQFGFDSEITKIDDRRKAAVDAKQAEIDKEQELADKEDERHNNRLKAIAAERQKLIESSTKVQASIQSQIDTFNSLKNQSGDAYDKVVQGFTSTEVKANGLAATLAAVNYLAAHPGATVEEAIAEGRKYMSEHRTVTAGTANAREGRTGVGSTSPSTTVAPTGSTSREYGGYEPGTSANTEIPQGGPGRNDRESLYSRLRKRIFYSPYPAIGSGDYYPSGKPHSSRYPHPIDYLAGTGTPVRAIMSGTVTARTLRGSFGKHVILNGSEGTAIYAHLSRFGKEGNVSAGEVIGYTGSTGNSSGPHLHFEWSRMGSGNAPTGQQVPGEPGSTDVPEDDVNAIEEAFNLPAGTVDKMKSGGFTAAFDLNSFIGRRRGGSMTMNKPYLVGEGGPEVFLPYGSGSRIAPIYNVPAASNGIMGGIVNNHGDIYISVDGSQNPEIVAKQVVSAINREKSRRSFGRGV